MKEGLARKLCGSIRIIILCILSVGVMNTMVSCVEEPENPRVQESREVQVMQVRTWFEENKSNLRLDDSEANYRTESQDLILPFFEKEPDWDKFHHYYFPDGREVFEISLENAQLYLPASSEDQEVGASGVIQNIMFVRDSLENRFDPLIVRYFPDDESSDRAFSELYYMAIDEKWSGWVDLFSYDEHHLVGFRIDMGERVSTRTFSEEDQEEAGQRTQINGRYKYDCKTIITDWYQVTIAGNSISYQKLNSTYTQDCGGGGAAMGSDMYFGGSTGKGSGSSSGSGGGNKPKSYSPPRVPAPNLTIQIDASFKNNPLAMCVLSKLELSSFVRSLALIGEGVASANVTLKIGKTINHRAFAETSKAKGVNNLVITLNAAYLDRGSLDIAGTLLHEIVHAEIYAAISKKNGTPLDANFESNFKKYVELYFKEGDTGIQHNYMAEKLVGRMADVLKQVHPYLGLQEFLKDPEIKKAFPKGLPADFYQGIAWSGLKFTDKWRYKLPERDAMVKYQNLFNDNIIKSCN